MKIYFHTFGCKANQYETELLRERMEKAGGESVGEASRADLCLVNSCSVTSKADKECRQILRQLLRRNPRARVVVTGCYATRAPQPLKDMSPRVEVYSNAEKDALPSCVGFELRPEIHGLSRYPERSRAFVKVQDGCNAPCRYCIIPSVRPTLWNKPVSHVLREIETLVKTGHREIVLTGIRLGLYRGAAGGVAVPSAGGKNVNLAGLVKRIVELTGDFRVRLSSLEVTEVSDAIIGLAADNPKLCRHFHVPLQSGDDDVLKAMGRWYSFKQYEDRVKAIRRRLPDAAITADVLAGYPTETETAFCNTCERVERLALSGLHVFPFSPRPGTPAAELKPLPPPVVKARAAKLLALGEKLRKKHQANFTGRARVVLTESDGFGWTDNYIRLRAPEGAAEGEFVKVTIEP